MIHRENLLKLARYLAGDEIAMKFDIGQFNDGGDPEQYVCGTAGCAVGHGPYAGFSAEGFKRWMDYCSYWFICRWEHNSEWEWCFCAEWRHSNSDNTAIGAAKRIFWLLKFGLPENALRQMLGEAPLCYCDMDISEFMDEANTEQLIGANAG